MPLSVVLRADHNVSARWSPSARCPSQRRFCRPAYRMSCCSYVGAITFFIDLLRHPLGKALVAFCARYPPDRATLFIRTQAPPQHADRTAVVWGISSR
ncbi:hypothetical protein KCP77_18365 [Salmonella enterica subsp. enterica]|nr:hypothetical protein KCP77_18365 [Salmonella enterica subsp. enterica]